MVPRPHVFLICVDALRADCFDPDAMVWSEGGSPATPALDELAAGSMVWTRAFSSSSWTKPSVPSMLTSLHPSEHGVLEVERRAGQGASAAALPDGVATLAELLRDQGYRTTGIAHNAQLDPTLGFDRGYDSYTCEGGTGDEIIARLLTLRPWATGPSFNHLHLIDPHWPFSRSVQERAEADSGGRFPFHRMRAPAWKELKADLKHGRVTLAEDESRFLRHVYRLAVEDVDRALRRLFVELSATGILEQSVIVFTSDHGEEMLDHGLVGHGQSLWDELIRIPLFLRVGNATGVTWPGPRRVDNELASHVDLLPTLAAVGGWKPTHRVAGRDLLAEPSPPFVFAEVKHKRRYRQAVTDGRWKLVRTYIFERELDDQGRSAADTNNLEELFADRPRRVERELYSLERDPGERRDLARVEPEAMKRLEAALDRWWEGRSPRGQHTRALEEELIRRLEALGYL
ncbi:MAG: sulfatase [Gemmatimonadota bacterium]|nr:MAG: sulfatase [Gemmatimonadota bacterium]